MKGLKIIEDELSCLIEDAILHKNDTYSKIQGNITRGFIIEAAVGIDNIKSNG